MSPEQLPPPPSPEQAYLKDLEQRISAESKGNVSLYTSADFPSDEKAKMIGAMLERNPERTPPAGNKPGGGWGEYGEIASDLTGGGDKLLKLPFGGTSEQLAFLDQGDGSTRLMYGFTSNFYLDGTGRPGNIMKLGFKIKQETAEQLQDVLLQNPGYIRTLVRQHCLAIGISEQYYTQLLAPRYKQFEAQGTFPDGTFLDVSEYDSSLEPISEPEKIPFSRHETLVIPVYGFAERQLHPKASDKSAQIEMAREFVVELEKDLTPSEVLAELADELALIDFDHASMSEEAKVRARQSTEAYRIIYDEKLRQLLGAADSFDANLAAYSDSVSARFNEQEKLLEDLRSRTDPLPIEDEVSRAELQLDKIDFELELLHKSAAAHPSTNW